MNIFRKKRGFTLIELMLVIIIISIVAAIATSSYLRARLNASEGATKGALKSIQGALINYRSANTTYPASLAVLGTEYIGGGVSAGTANGYNYVLNTANLGETFTVVAVPSRPGFSGNNGYCTDTLNAVYQYVNIVVLAGDGNACPPGGVALSG